MSLPAKAHRFLTEFVWILRGQMYVLRRQWFWYVVYLSFSPLTRLFFLWIYGGARDPKSHLYIATGSVANAAAASAMLSLGQTIGRLRDQNALEYYASLPISKISFILALATRGVLLSLPSSATVLAVGMLALNLPLTINPIPALLAYFFGAYSLAGLGAIIGFYSTDSEMVGLITQVVVPLLVLFAPVYVPIAKLPSVLQATAKFLPTTYVASCLRSAILGSVGLPYWRDLVVVVIWFFVCLLLALVRVDWRGAQE